MRRALVRGWWALPVAAGLSLIVPAPAQPPGPALGGLPGLPAPPRPAASAPSAEETARFAEITVELGWLADPMTFPCHLAVLAQAGSVEIRGFVPNDTVRARAVKVAHERSKLRVVDHLKLHPVTVPTTRKSPEELHAAAVGALKAGFPKLTPGINVLCRPFGQVILTGRVESMEEKLAISQALRRLPGCTSVLNQLGVGFTTTTVRIPPNGQPGTFNANPMAARPAQPSHGGPDLAGPLLPAVGGGSPYSPTSPYAASTRSAPATSKSYAASWAGPALVPAPLPLLPATGSPIEHNVQGPTLTPMPILATGQIVQTSYRPEGVPQGMIQSAVLPAPAPALASVPQPVQPAQAKPMVARMAVLPPGEPYVTTGVLLFADTDTITAKRPLPAKRPAPRPNVASKPAVRPTVVATPAVQPRDPWARRQALLKQAIEASCGPAVKGVQVELRSADEALIRFEAASKAEADRIWSDIQRVPELAPYKLDVVIKAP